MSGSTSNFTSAIRDPFDMANVDNYQQPGFLGVSPDVWRSLAGFGGNLAAAANARTPGGFLAYGGGLVGPLGAAISTSQQQGLNRGQALADIGYRSALAQNSLTDAMLKRFQIPLMQQEFSLLQQGINSFGGGGSPFAPAQAQGDTPPGGSTYAQGVHSIEGNGQNPNWPASAGGPLGPHQFTAETWKQFAGENPQLFTGKSPDEILAARTDPQLSATATDWYAAKNTPILKAAGVDPSPQNLAIAHTLGGAGAAGVLKFPDEASLPQAIQSTQPNAASAILRENPQFARMTVGDLKARYSKVGAPAPYQVAQAGNGPLPISGMGSSQPQTQQAPTSLAPGADYTQNPAYQRAMDYYHKAAIFGMSPLTSQLAQTFRTMADREYQLATAGPMATAEAAGKAGVQLQTAGPIAREEAEAKAPFQITRLNPGGVAIDATGALKGFAPVQSEEVLTSGPNKGMQVKVFRSPLDGSVIGTQPATGSSPEQPSGSTLPAGAIPTGLSPRDTEILKSQGELPKEMIEHDRTEVEGDLSHVLENVLPAKQQLFQLRSKIDSADTGAQGDLRADMKNFVQTYFPSVADTFDWNAAPAQEFRKLALMGSGKQERGDLGARGGFRAIELYMKANPTMENQPTANHDMANALLVFHQAHEDYANGAVDFYNKNVSNFQNAAEQGGGKYNQLSQYDNQYIKTFRPELYSAAISAINGSAYGDWSKGLSNKQIQIVGGILQRADPSAVVDLAGHKVPVSSFKTVMSPMDIMAQNGR